MSVQTELQRIIQAKADIITSIENKGVTVPSGTTIDNLDDYVDQIEQGGGGESDIRIVGKEWADNELFYIEVSSTYQLQSISIYFYGRNANNTYSVIQYKVNNGDWNNVLIPESVSDTTYLIVDKLVVSVGDKIYFKGTKSMQNFNFAWQSGYPGIRVNKNGTSSYRSCYYNIGGNVQSIYYDVKDESKYKALGRLFDTSQDLVSAGNLILEGTNIPIYYMFNNCSRMTTGPSLRNLKYTSTSTLIWDTFYGCTAMTNWPGLPEDKYNKMGQMSEMFYNCRSITGTVDVPFYITNPTNMNNMFYGCTGITKIIFKSGNFNVSSNFCRNSSALTVVWPANKKDTWTNKPSSVVLEYEPMDETCFYFQSKQNGSTVGYTDTGTVEAVWSYWKTGDTDWTVWDGTAVTLNEDEKLYIYTSTLSTSSDKFGLSSSTSDYRKFVTSGNLSINGYYPTLSCSNFPTTNSTTRITDYNYYKLFENNTAITDIHIWTQIYNNMAGTYKTNVFNSMFAGCTGLTDVTDIILISDENKNVITNSPYAGANAFTNIFANCTNLVTIDMGYSGYQPSGSYASEYLFTGCTSLKNILLPKWSFSTSPSFSSNFFNGINNLTFIRARGGYARGGSDNRNKKYNGFILNIADVYGNKYSQEYVFPMTTTMADEQLTIVITDRNILKKGTVLNVKLPKHQYDFMLDNVVIGDSNTMILSQDYSSLTINCGSNANMTYTLA